MVDNSDTGNVTTVGTWDTSKAGQDYQGYNYRTAPAGDGSNTFTWTPVIPADGTYEVMVKYPSGVDGAATDARYVVDYGGLLNDVTTVDQSSGGGTWVSLGSFSLDEGNSATIELSDNANGTVLADGVKLVRDTSNDPADTESKSFDYTYDINGNLTSLADASSGAEVDAYDMAYDGLNQLSKVVEKASGTVQNTTAYTYDANGNTLTRSHDSQDAEFVYDARDLVKQVTNTRTGKSPKVTSYGYTARGQIASTTKPNGNVVNYNYNLDGSVASQRETTTGGGLVAEHVLAYNANGHRVRDEATVQNADDPTAYLDHVYSYEFDPQDRLSSVTKRDASDSSIVSSESYTHDANANVIKQTINGTTTSFTYDRNRLLTASSGGTSASYNYDPFGRLNSVTSGGEIIESYEYDGFDRMVEHAKLDTDTGNLSTTTYDYDPLDRTTSKTEGGSTTSFDYLGLSDKVVSEEIDGALSRSYTYNAWGQRLSQVKHDASAGTEETSYYGYNLHSDVETLTDSNGQTIGTYGYTAYGKDDKTSFTGVDKPDPNNPDAEPYNAYRFNGKRWDANSESYDMGFRDYSPGLNRFLTRDSYNGALADMGLGMDPWTGNRYAFTGGNPITGIEIDGHTPCIDEGDCIEYKYMGPDTGLVKKSTEEKAEEQALEESGTTKAELSKAKQLAEDDRSGFDVFVDELMPILGDISGYTDVKNCVTAGDAWACVSALVNVLPIGKAWKALKNSARIAKAVMKAFRWADEVAAAKRTVALVQSRTTQLVNRACGTKNSFVPGTLVLMADGSYEPIEDIEIGDRVWATDPEKGEAGPRTVTDTIIGTGQKDLVELTVDIDGDRGGEVGTIVATDGHPFWVPKLREWKTAGELREGSLLRTSAGTRVQVERVETRTARERVHNLTVNDIHTYHVLAGTTPVLVHNTNGADACDLTLGAGPHAQEGVGLVDGNINAPGVRDMVNQSGKRHGCHTCGTTTPGTPRGNWIPDHQPPTSMVRRGTPQTAYPHCVTCARSQGGTVTQLNRGNLVF